MTDKIRGISYPGDDGSEPADVRQRKAELYAQSVTKNAEEQARAIIAERDRSSFSRAWKWLTTPHFSVLSAMICVSIGFAIGKFLARIT